MPERLDQSKSLSTLELNSLLETSKLLAASSEIDEMLSHILRTVMGKYVLSRAAIAIIERQGESDRYTLAKYRGLISPPKHFENLNAFMEAYHFEQCIPLVSQTRRIGCLLLGKKITSSHYTNAELAFLESLATLTASALESAFTLQELKHLNRNLNQTVQKLKTLFELTNSYTVGLSRNEILKIFSRSVSGQMLIGAYMVILRGESGKPITELSLGVEVHNRSQGQQLQDELEKIFQLQAPTKVLNNDYPSLYLAGLRYIIPMRNNDKTLGVFLSGERLTKQPFSDTDLEFISLAAAQAATALEQSRLFKETLEVKAIEKELQVAKEIQAALLPKTLPAIDGIDLAARNIPTKQVGGDYYDIMMLDDHHLFLAIADVTGKGTPAALLMANLQATIKAYMTAFTPETLDLSKVVGNINNIIYENTPADKFITFFCAIFNLQTRTMVSVNAGHNPPYLLKRSGALQTLTKGGLILGVISTLMPYEMESTTLNSGDTLLLFTDGVTEAMNPQREEFGDERLIALLKSVASQPASAIIDHIITQTAHFQPPGEQHDDITLVCMKLLR